MYFWIGKIVIVTFLVLGVALWTAFVISIGVYWGLKTYWHFEQLYFHNSEGKTTEIKEKSK